MNFFNKVVSKLFDKEDEDVIENCIAFDESGLVFTIFVRNEVPKEQLKFVMQEYARQKDWFIRHTGPASMTLYQIEPEKRTIQGEKERIMQLSWSSPDSASIYLFRDLAMEFSDLVASQCMLKLQTKPIPALAAPMELKDFQPQEVKPIDQMNPDEVLESIKSNHKSVDEGLSEDKRALAEHVVFEEDDDTGGIFRVACRLNKDCKSAIAISILANVSNGLDCTSFELKKEKSSCTVGVVLKTGQTLELVMTVGINKDKQRILHGTYPELHAAYGRQFWIRFAEALSKNGCLQDQKMTIAPTQQKNTANASGSQNPSVTAAAIPQQDDLADDSGLEYDSSEYNSETSENSVDSDDD